jgi:succinyl-CoA synthetase alpha subunit
MSDTVINDVRRGFYLDSVALMRLSRTISEREGVSEAALMMGTPANKRLMADAGLLQAAGVEATGGDLVIGIRAADARTADLALAQARDTLDRPVSADGNASAWRPRSLQAAVKGAPESNLALISVPGGFAVAEARKAIHNGLHVMIFSDNVDVEEEAALKREAAGLGRLVMGPDCGTAIIGGTPLAFANAVPRGSIGIVGASGTGMQEVSCLIARQGQGISQAIGVGGRDLCEAVGAVSTLMALDALDADPETQHIVLISKPPPASVAARVMDRIAASPKKFTVCLVGGGDRQVPGNAETAVTLKEAAALACGGAGLIPPFDAASLAAPLPANRTSVCGLFCGGTLCAEAQWIFEAGRVAVASNAPIPGVARMGESPKTHCMIDLGADEYTSGRPHPMIDPGVRDEAMLRALESAHVGVVLVDVVIGYGAHADPAGHLAGVIARHASNDGATIIASVTGTEDDPQRRPVQIAKLEAAGVLVAPCNADAAALALAMVHGVS